MKKYIRPFNLPLAVLVLLAFLAFWGNVVKADSFEEARSLHDYAHTGGGFVVNTGAYGIWKLVMLPEDHLTAHFFAILTTAIVAASKEANDLSNGGKFSGRDFGYSMLGAGAFTAAAIAFDF